MKMLIPPKHTKQTLIQKVLNAWKNHLEEEKGVDFSTPRNNGFLIGYHKFNIFPSIQKTFHFFISYIPSDESFLMFLSDYPTVLKERIKTKRGEGDISISYIEQSIFNLLFSEEYSQLADEDGYLFFGNFVKQHKSEDFENPILEIQDELGKSQFFTFTGTGNDIQIIELDL